ncbi:hsp70-binding protein 1 [Tribolium castaneum]|uniref:Hsp70-binding protein 1 n=1 Tax=Tribolium castaneum TaxID=7070 RepID=D6X1Z2_TRICA|nr:PREDICTED: hsp70-binding protein 1 [Tribolium castaneum]EFA09946.1 Hsp70-binding protein 1-like Protein [Tribolium castaneum]|eukprot:XP_971541.1 PREDICTED: hsp70-binding protein 1 [Tribolium castaneum]
MTSNQENQPQIAGAICAPPPQPPTGDVPQPRQPTNLQGLLKFAMEATKLEDAPRESTFQPMEEARRKFLEEALNSLTVDVIEVLLKQIKILEKVDTLNAGDDDSEYTTALDTISDFVCDIDTANDFHKIGGFVIVSPCLKCKSPKVRAQVCNLLAELCQNNAYCQRVVLESGIMPILVEIVEQDPEVSVVVKALYAISCIVRQNTGACAQFIQYKGVQVFLEALKRNEEKINTKICFLLRALCSSQADFKSRLVFVGYIPVLFSLLSTPKTSDEHVLGLLQKLIEDNSAAINESRQNKVNAKETLENYLSQIKGKEEYSNEEELCDTIYNTLFAQK